MVIGSILTILNELDTVIKTPEIKLKLSTIIMPLIDHIYYILTPMLMKIFLLFIVIIMLLIYIIIILNRSIIYIN